MCCFRLHFSDFNVLFFQKKNVLQFTFEKITCCAKREKKITCREEKSQPPPPWISNGPSLSIDAAHTIKLIQHKRKLMLLVFILGLQTGSDKTNFA